MSLTSPCGSCPHKNFVTGTTSCDPSSCLLLKGQSCEIKRLQDRERTLLTAINTLMAERRALRSLAAAFGLPRQISRARRLELAMEHLRLEGVARQACAAAGLVLPNNDQAFEEAKVEETPKTDDFSYCMSRSEMHCENTSCADCKAERAKRGER